MDGIAQGSTINLSYILFQEKGERFALVILMKIPR
jgi:hypothetical protein